MMLADPSKKYRRMYQRVDLPDRQWPNNEITKAPIWMSTDLRDGNQAIFEPMNMEQKFKMFKMLVKIGFKHIEIGFPSASPRRTIRTLGRFSLRSPSRTAGRPFRPSSAAALARPVERPAPLPR